MRLFEPACVPCRAPSLFAVRLFCACTERRRGDVSLGQPLLNQFPNHTARLLLWPRWRSEALARPASGRTHPVSARRCLSAAETMPAIGAGAATRNSCVAGDKMTPPRRAGSSHPKHRRVTAPGKPASSRAPFQDTNVGRSVNFTDWSNRLPAPAGPPRR